MKIKKIWGAGGTGKSYYLANYLKTKEENDELFSFLITSYTHVGKNEIYKKYLELTGRKELLNNYNPIANYDKCKTFHSIVYHTLKQHIKEEIKRKRKQMKLIDFYKKDDELDEEIKEEVSKLFLRDYNNKEYAFEVNFNNLKKLLELEENRKRLLFEIYNMLDNLESEENKISIDFLKRKISSLRDSELVFLVLLVEGNIYDKGHIIDPFKQKIIDSKLDYTVEKYFYLFDVFIKEKLEEVLEYLLSEDYSSPLHPVYNIRKFYELLKVKGYKKKLGTINTIIIDEAQDMPEIAFYFLKEFYNYDEIILAGDPYQAIFLDLGFNSFFVDKENAIIFKTLWRYPKEYLLSIRRFFRDPVLVFDLIQNYNSSNNTDFILRKHNTYSKDPYLEVGLKVMDSIKNNINDIILTHNVKKFRWRQDQFKILPYKDYLSINIGSITNYITFHYLNYLLNKNQESKHIFETLIHYYDYYPKWEYLLLKTKKDLETKYNINKKDNDKTVMKILDENKEKNLSRELFNILKPSNNKPFVIMLSVHRSKGKTLYETIHYIPTKGLYYYLEVKNNKYFFIHNLLKYVALTRPANRLVYHLAIRPF